MANIQSHILCALAVWGPMISSKGKKTLERKMTQARKAINDKLSDKEIRIKYKILDFDELMKIELCKLSYRHEKDTLPKKLRNLFDLKHHEYNTTRNANAPRIPVHWT